MKILWMTWKDRKHPLAGGAELVNEHLAKRLVRDHHQVVLLVGGFNGARSQEFVDGYHVLRVGNMVTVYLQALKHYLKHFRGWPDLIIDETNTVPFFSQFYTREKQILFFHMLCREIWYYRMFFPLNHIGYFLEPLYLKLLANKPVITVSQSTKQDLIKVGFPEKNISIISEGIDLTPIDDPTKVEKYPKPTLLAFGALRSMKQTDHIVRAFEKAKDKILDLQLLVAGAVEDNYGENVLKLINSSPHSNSIKYLGRVSPDQRLELLQKSHFIASTAVKEGWGLTVTEAASQGTPAIVYDTDGLRDSVRHNQTGFTSPKNDIPQFADTIAKAFGLNGHYQQMQLAAWNWSKQINFDKSYQDFKQVIAQI